ncbi:MAG: hypothetical protein AAF512_15280, partial [Pseudomonadota bacterium]
ILPWYTLHQTFIIIAAFYLSSLGMPIGVEVVLLLTLVYGGCFVCYELIKRFTITRFLFGLRLEVPSMKTQEGSAAKIAIIERSV